MLRPLQMLDEAQASLLADIMGTDFYEENDLLAVIAAQEKEMMALLGASPSPGSGHGRRC